MIRSAFLLPLLACSSFLVIGALSRQGAAPVLCGAHDAPPEKGLPAAAELLAEAAAALAPERVAWLDTAVWQHVQCPDGHFVAHGRFLTAPGKRQRLELTVRVGKTEGKLVLVSDGRMVSQTMRVGSGDPVVSRRSLAEPGAGSSDPILGDLLTAGLDQLFAGIRQRLVGPKVRRASWRGQPVFQVRGEWQAGPPRPGDVLPGMRPPTAPQSCVVLLDARTLWPCRVEWATDDERHTWQVEFRDPQLNQPLPPALCAGLFAVPAAGP